MSLSIERSLIHSSKEFSGLYSQLAVGIAVCRKRKGIFSLYWAYVNNFPISSGWETARGYTPDISWRIWPLVQIKSFPRYSTTFREIQDNKAILLHKNSSNSFLLSLMYISLKTFLFLSLTLQQSAPHYTYC